MLLFLKATCHPCIENIAVAAKRNILNDFVTFHIKKFSTPAKRKSEGRKSGMHSNYVMVKLFIMLHGNPR